MIDYNTADVISAQDYYPFGMIMPGRTIVNGSGYRYGFNGKENDNEVKGTGNQQDYGMRIYDPRLAKFLSVDPLTNKFAWFSPYQFAGNTPLRAIDKDGEEPKDYSWNWESKGSTFIGKWGQDVKTVFDNWTTTTWSVMSYPNQGEIYYWKPYDGSQGTFDFENNGKANKDAKGNWTGAWQRFERQETIQARLGSELADGFATTVFGMAAVGGAIPLINAAVPFIASFASNYGVQAISASTGSRLISGGTNAVFQYIQNAPEFSWGVDNLRNINFTSIGFAALNPTSIGGTALMGNFLKTTINDGTSQSIGGSNFNLKTALIGSGIDYAGGKFSNLLGKYAGQYTNTNINQSSLIGNAVSGGVTTPASIIASEADKQKKE
jgi:RHS repeat-associated protein